jgi:uracil-DNA glycosylase
MATPKITLPGGWASALGGELEKPYFHNLMEFVKGEREKHKVFPPEGEVFSAFELTPYPEVKVMILGQDPYPTEGDAHGLCFSVKPGVKPPKSLANIFRELHDDVGFRIPNNGNLVPWARQGVLLLNAVLTVREAAPNSHAGKGWETFTDAVIRAVSDKTDPVVFMLWGKYAQKKESLIDAKRHVVLKGVHPSPLSAKMGFFGSKPFSKINAELTSRGKPAIDWQLPDL